MEEKKDPKYYNAAKKSYDWFDTDRNAKKDIQDELAEFYRLYNCDHWSMRDSNGRTLRNDSQKKNHPNTVENVAFSLIEGLVAEFSEDIDIIDYPVEPGDEDTAIIMTDLKKFVMYKNRISTEREKFLRNFFLYGTGIWHIFWDPNWRGGCGPNRWVGDVRWKAVHPQVVFPDARCRESIEDGQRIHKAFFKTVEYIRDIYGVDVQPDVTTSSDYLGEEDRTTPIGEDTDEALLVETWYKGKPLILNEGEKDQGNGMHVIWWAGDGNPTYLKHANYIYYEPGETPQFPLIFRARYPRENSVWGFGEGHFLKSPQIVLNKTSELITEAHMHFALGQTFYSPGAITPKQEKFLKRFGTLPNAYFPINNLEGIKRIHGKGVDPSLQNESNRVQRMMEAIIGRHDISQGRTPGSVTAFRALDLLAARARVRLRSAEQAMLSAYEDCGNYVNNLIHKFYTQRRAYRIMGSNDTGRMEYELANPQTGEVEPYQGQVPPGTFPMQARSMKPQYGFFQPESIRKIFNGDTGEVLEFGAVELTEENAEQYEVYCPQMDVKCRVSSSLPTDRVFFMEVAKELFLQQLIDPETFFFVMSQGRFPPYEELMEKLRMQQMMAAQQQMTQQNSVASAFQQRPDLQAKFSSLPPEAQKQILASLQG